MICKVQQMGHSGTCPGQIRKCPVRKGSGDLGTFGTCVFRTCPIVPSRHDELLSCRISGSGCAVASVVNRSLSVVTSHLAAALGSFPWGHALRGTRSRSPERFSEFCEMGNPT